MGGMGGGVEGECGRRGGESGEKGGNHEDLHEAIGSSYLPHPAVSSI